MKKSGTLLLLAIALWGLQACTKVTGEGPVITETRDRGSFSALAVSISGDIYYKQSAVYSIEIQAQRNILDVLETSVVNSELVLKFRNNVNVRSHDRITVTVSAPSINSLTLSGSGNVNVIGIIQPNSMHVNVSGSGNITIPALTTSVLDATISGSGNITIQSGAATEETLKISGSGSMDMLSLVGKNVNTTTSGSGSIKVNATESLHSTISGSGAVYYKGNPVVTTSISGSGRVRPY